MSSECSRALSRAWHLKIFRERIVITENDTGMIENDEHTVCNAHDDVIRLSTKRHLWKTITSIITSNSKNNYPMESNDRLFRNDEIENYIYYI